MKNLVLAIIMIIASQLVSAQGCVEIMNDLPNRGVTPFDLGAGVATHHNCNQIMFTPSHIELVQLVSDTVVWLGFKTGEFIMLSVKRDSFTEDRPLIYPINRVTDDAFPDDPDLSLVAYTSQLADITIYICRFPKLENLWNRTYFRQNRLLKSDAIVCIFRNSNDIESRQTAIKTVYSSINKQVSKDGHLFNVQTPFKNLLWSGVGYAHFGAPQKFIN